MRATKKGEEIDFSDFHVESYEARFLYRANSSIHSSVSLSVAHALRGARGILRSIAISQFWRTEGEQRVSSVVTTNIAIN